MIAPKYKQCGSAKVCIACIEHITEGLLEYLNIVYKSVHIFIHTSHVGPSLNLEIVAKSQHEQIVLIFIPSIMCVS